MKPKSRIRIRYGRTRNEGIARAWKEGIYLFSFNRPHTIPKAIILTEHDDYDVVDFMDIELINNERWSPPDL